jgi:tetratricopeptide (TPR) repeat protein
MRQQVFGEVHAAIAESLTDLGRILRAQEDGTGALAFLERARALHEKLEITRGYDAAFTCNPLGRLLCETGEYDKAQRHLEQALAIWERIGGLEYPERIPPLKNLALVRLAKATDEALRLCNERLGSQHPWLAGILRVRAEAQR